MKCFASNPGSFRASYGNLPGSTPGQPRELRMAPRDTKYPAFEGRPAPAAPALRAALRAEFMIFRQGYAFLAYPPLGSPHLGGPEWLLETTPGDSRSGLSSKLSKFCRLIKFPHASPPNSSRRSEFMIFCQGYAFLAYPPLGSPHLGGLE